MNIDKIKYGIFSNLSEISPVLSVLVIFRLIEYIPGIHKFKELMFYQDYSWFVIIKTGIYFAVIGISFTSILSIILKRSQIGKKITPILQKSQLLKEGLNLGLELFSNLPINNIDFNQIDTKMINAVAINSESVETFPTPQDLQYLLYSKNFNRMQKKVGKNNSINKDQFVHIIPISKANGKYGEKISENGKFGKIYFITISVISIIIYAIFGK